MKYIVINPKGKFLIDQGLVPSKKNPYGGPGRFGDRTAAFEFASKRLAERAHRGLLGPGRNCWVLEA